MNRNEKHDIQQTMLVGVATVQSANQSKASDGDPGHFVNQVRTQEKVDNHVVVRHRSGRPCDVEVRVGAA